MTVKTRLASVKDGRIKQLGDGVLCGLSQAVRSIVERQCKLVGAQLIQTFSEEEVAAILRRASELQSARTPGETASPTISTGQPDWL